MVRNANDCIKSRQISPPLRKKPIMVAMPSGVTLWKYRRIPYEFESGYPHESDVRTAMDKWENAGGVSIVVHRNEPN